MKLCKDCKHCIPLPQKRVLFWPIFTEAQRLTYAKCALFTREQEINPVTGELDPPIPEHRYCDTVRNFGLCGVDAKLFEPKD